MANPTTHQQTKLTYELGGTAPSLVLDFAKDVGGNAKLDVASTFGAVIETAYSEPLADLGNAPDHPVFRLEAHRGIVDRTSRARLTQARDRRYAAGPEG